MSVHFKLEAVSDVEQFSTIETIKNEISNLQPLLLKTGMLFEQAPEQANTVFWENYFNTHPTDLAGLTTWEEL